MHGPLNVRFSEILLFNITSEALKQTAPVSNIKKYQNYAHKNPTSLFKTCHIFFYVHTVGALLYLNLQRTVKTTIQRLRQCRLWLTSWRIRYVVGNNNCCDGVYFMNIDQMV